MAKVNAGVSARQLLQGSYHGVLSTISQDVAGYPFGSMAPYCLDYQGRPIILISRLAQHTKNIVANPKVSLMLTQCDADSIHEAARLTLIADARPIEKDEHAVVERYYRFFPALENYHIELDFEFYRLHVVKARYIAGFANIHWVDVEDLCPVNCLSPAQEAQVVAHMNADHRDANHHYMLSHGKLIAADDEVSMVGVDREGFFLAYQQAIVRIDFSEPASTMGDVRKNLVAMAQT